MHFSKTFLLITVILLPVSICLPISTVFSGECEGVTSSSVVALPFEFHVVKDKGRWVTLAATSGEIEWDALDEAWPKRYKAFKYGGGAAIAQWKLDSVPPNGTLYEGARELAAGDIISDPDDLYYTPRIGFEGSDQFGYCVSDTTGHSRPAVVDLKVVSAENYPMPIGMPDPGFGIAESPPPDPAGWMDAEVPGWYYIDSDHPGCSDALDYGYPNEPRCTIPTNAIVDAGHKMVLAQSNTSYELRNSGWDRIYMNGQPGKPAWIVGDERSPTKPRITINSARGDGLTELRVAGTGHYRVSGIDMDGPNFRNYGSGDNIVIRYSRFRNYPSTAGGGTTVGLSPVEGQSRNILVFHVNAHDNGIVSPTLADERDIHAFVGTRQKDFWLLDILCSENAGDCVQLTNNNTTENIYVGRATMHSMMENCIDFKDFNNFVVSESDCWDIRHVSYSSGSGGRAQNFYVNDEGVQQGFGYFINNRSWDTSGPNFASANVDGRVYFIGNRAFFSPAGTGLAGMNGAGERHYYFNTVSGMRDGMNFYTVGTPGGRYASGNYVGNTSRYDLFAAAAYAKMNILNYNVYIGTGLFAWGSSSGPTTGDLDAFRSVTGFDVDAAVSLVHGFHNAQLYDYRLTPSSQLIDFVPKAQVATIAPGLVDMASDLGVDFKDYNGTVRSDDRFDAGADEYEETNVPAAPSDLHVF